MTEARTLFARFVKSWDTLSIILVTSAGLILGVVESIPKFRGTIAVDSVILILLGVIGTHFAIERFSTISRIERKLDLVNDAAPLAEFGPAQQRMHAEATRDYLAIQRAIARLSSDEMFFAKLTDSLMKPSTQLLAELAKGRLIVPPYQVVAAQETLGRAFTKRFDAVSEKDIDFWDERVESEEYFIAAGYFRQNSDAIKRGTTVTRIFILALRDLMENIDRLTTILEQQHRAGIGWGIVVQEEMADELRHPQGRLDFAIFDHGKAITYFRREYPRRFETVLRISFMPENEREVQQQIRIHQCLLAECWMVNPTFIECYKGAHGDNVAAEVDAMLTRRNEHVRRFVDDFQVNKEPFAFVADKPAEVRDKLKAMHTLIAGYRIARGADPQPSERT